MTREQETKPDVDTIARRRACIYDDRDGRTNRVPPISAAAAFLRLGYLNAESEIGQFITISAPHRHCRGSQAEASDEGGPQEKLPWLSRSSAPINPQNP